MTSRTRGTSAVLAVLGLVLALSACSGSGTPATSRAGNTIAAVTSYQPGPGPDQLTVRFMRDKKHGPGVGRVLQQDGSHVVVQVSYDGDGSMDLVEHEVVLDLDAPLGDRAVVDSDNMPVALVGLSTTGTP